MSDYIDRLEAIEKEEEDFNKLVHVLAMDAPPLMNLGVIEPQKVQPLMFERTKKRLFSFTAEHPEEGTVWGCAWEGWQDNHLIFFFIWKSFMASVHCRLREGTKKNKLVFFDALSPGRYADLFTYIDATFLKQCMQVVYNKVALLLAEEAWS